MAVPTAVVFLRGGGGALALSCCKTSRSLRSPLSFAGFFSISSDSEGNRAHMRRAADIRKAQPFSSVSTRTFSNASWEAESEALVGTISDPPDKLSSSVCATDSAEAAFSSSSSSGPAASIKDAAGALDIRVGRILRAWRHSEADTLYVEEVDVGDPEPRTICSGLVNYIPLDDLQGMKVIVLANLKPRNMRGVKSNGMLLAASDARHENVELLVPPEGSVPGERIWFGLEEEKHNEVSAATPNQVYKKKIWEAVQPHLKTDQFCVAVLGDHPMRTSAGMVKCRSLQDAKIS